MIKSKFKRVTSLFLATLMCVTTFAGIGSTTAYAASGEKADVYMVDFPRDGDANYDGVWGHSNLTLKNGWHTGRSNFTNLKAIGSYSGNVAYCIEPGISLKVGQTMNKYDENYFNNLAANGVISGDEIRLFVGRILQYGYRGTISTSWRSQNEAAANSIAQAYATQLLIWETVIGERDANFNHVAASGCSNVKDVINAKHPLRNKIFSYYNSMVQSVQNHATIPSFCNKSSGSAKTIELEWNGSKYTTTLTDSNNVLSKYNFKASISGVSFSVNGNKLTVSMDTAPSKEFTITATKKNAVRRGVVVWSEGKHGQNSSVQDVVSYAQEVSDSINGYVKMKVSYGSCQIVKTSEDGKVDGINFTITGNGINQTVTTANGGKFQIDNLMPGIYTVTEQVYDKYEPQETHRVTVVAGQVAKVNFNNKLKRGDLQVVKSSEDNLVEGVKFHLFGTSLSGDAVDQYAVTDKDGVATFKDVLISGSEPYTLEEVDTAIRYVVPKNQTAPVKWKEVTTRNFNNILKKFTVTVMEMLRAGAIEDEDDPSPSPLDNLFSDLMIDNPDHIALKYYHSYHSGSSKTLKSIQITLAARLEKFNLESLAALTSADELDLQSLGEKKVALFALIPDNDSSFNFLVSILYTQLFQQLFYAADHIHGGCLPMPVHFMMDEFANVSLPDDFDKILSVMRSRGVSVSIILQNLAQLKALFEKQWESIVGNCDEFLYLGGNEQSTHKYVSELLGKETIDTNTFGKSTGRSGNYSTNYQISGRELLTPDEVRMLDNQYAILFIRGERPIMDFKYDIMKHPNVALTTDGKASPYKHGEVTKDIASIAIWDIDPATLPEKEMEETNWELLSDEEMEALFINNQTN